MLSAAPPDMSTILAAREALQHMKARWLPYLTGVAAFGLVAMSTTTSLASIGLAMAAGAGAALLTVSAINQLIIEAMTQAANGEQFIVAEARKGDLTLGMLQQFAGDMRILNNGGQVTMFGVPLPV